MKSEELWMVHINRSQTTKLHLFFFQQNNEKVKPGEGWRRKWNGRRIFKFNVP